MKKALFFLLLVFVSLISGAKTTISKMNFESYAKSNCMRPIHYVYQTSNGYTITVDGSLGYSILNPFHFSFNGTVTITGNGVNLALPINGNFVNNCDSGSVDIYSTDGDVFQEVATYSVWQTTSTVANELLNDADFDSSFIYEINNS